MHVHSTLALAIGAAGLARALPLEARQNGGQQLPAGSDYSYSWRNAAYQANGGVRGSAGAYEDAKDLINAPLKLVANTGAGVGAAGQGAVNAAAGLGGQLTSGVGGGINAGASLMNDVTAGFGATLGGGLGLGVRGGGNINVKREEQAKQDDPRFSNDPRFDNDPRFNNDPRWSNDPNGRDRDDGRDNWRGAGGPGAAIGSIVDGFMAEHYKREAQAPRQSQSNDQCTEKCEEYCKQYLSDDDVRCEAQCPMRCKQTIKQYGWNQDGDNQIPRYGAHPDRDTRRENPLVDPQTANPKEVRSNDNANAGSGLGLPFMGNGGSSGLPLMGNGGSSGLPFMSGGGDASSQASPLSSLPLVGGSSNSGQRQASSAGGLGGMLPNVGGLMGGSGGSILKRVEATSYADPAAIAFCSIFEQLGGEDNESDRTPSYDDSEEKCPLWQRHDAEDRD